MAKSFNEILQDIVNQCYEQLLQNASDAINDVMPFFDKAADDGDGSKFIVPIICTVMAADGKFSQLEFKFIKELLNSNMSYDEFKNVIQQYYSESWRNTVDQLIDACDTKTKASLLCLCTYFAAVDETISKEETAFLRKLMD